MVTFILCVCRIMICLDWVGYQFAAVCLLLLSENIFIRVSTLHRVTAALSVDTVGVNLLTLNVSMLS